MRKLNKKLYINDDYRELFTVSIDRNKCTDDVVGITNDGKLLLIKEKMANQSSFYYMEREFFSINNKEYIKYLDLAKLNGEIDDIKYEELKEKNIC